MTTPVTLTDYLKGRTCKGFNPRPHYVRSGDCLTVFFSEAFAYEEHVNDDLIIYRSADTGEVTGCRIEGVARMVEQGDHAAAKEPAPLSPTP